MTRTEACKIARSKIKKHGNQHTKAKELGLTVIQTEETRKKKSDAGKSRRHSEETKKKMSDVFRTLTHRRLRRKMIEYKGIMLDSTWELRLAKLLDTQGIKWYRPAPLVYIDSQNKERHYFPDFYLPAFDMYLDPKNPHAYEIQKEKIEQLQHQFNNIRFLISEEEIDNFAPIAQLE